MAILFSKTIDRFSRILIIIASFFAIAAFTLIVVGTVTQSWYYSESSNGNFQSYNLFTICSGNVKNSTSTCNDILRDTSFGSSVQIAAALLVVGVCFTGCGMLISIAMNFIKFTSILLVVAPTSLFLASLFILASFAELSRVSLLNSYSAHLVQAGQMSIIFALCIISFAAGRLHTRFYERF